MKDRIIQVWYLKNSRTWFLSSFLFLIFCSPSFSQTEIYFSSKGLSSAQLLSNAGKVLDKPFNYIDQKLPSESFTFSFSGSETAFLNLLSKLLNRKVIPLGDSLIAVQSEALLSSAEEITFPKITNQVFDSYGDPLIGCNIWSTKLKTGAQTDINGQFELSGYFANSEMFSISYIGFEERLVPYSLLIHSNPIVLKSKSHELGAIIVTDYVNPVKDNLETMTMATDKIAAVGIGDQDALGLAQLLPGVFNSGESLSDLQIRGGPPDQVSFKWNNIQIYQSSLFYGHISAINPFMTDQVTVTKNGAAAKDNSNASGNINMSNNLAAIDTTELKLHADLLYTNVGLKTSLFNNKLKVQTAWRKSLPDQFRGLVYENTYNSIFQFGKLPDLDYYFDKFDLEGIIRWENDFSFRDFSASALLNITPKLTFQIDYLNYGNEYTLRRLHTFDPAVEQDNLELNSTGISGVLNYRWNDNLTSSVKAFKSDYIFDFEFLSDEEDENTIEREQKNTVYNTSIQFDNEFKYNWLRLNFGYSREHWDADHIDISMKRIYYQDGKKSFEDAAYLQSNFRLNQKLELDAGLRVSKYSRAFLGALYWEPRVHLSYMLTSAITAHAHYGHFHQVLTKRTGYSPLFVENDFWHLSDQRFGTSNWIHAIRNRQWSGGLDFKKGFWHLKLDAYQKEISNIWTASLDFTIEEDLYRFADMSVKGVEFSANFQRKWLMALLTYDYVKETVQIYDFPSTVNSPFSQPHRFSTFLNVRKKRFDVFAKWQFASGRYYSFPTELKYFGPDEGDYYDLQFDEGLLSRQVKSYHRLDAGLSYNLKFRNKKMPSSKIGLHFINLYNTNNIIKNQYFIDYKEEELKIGLLERKGLPFTWNVSLDLVF